MAILVTGSSGFVGLNVLEALLARGEEVVSFSLTPLPPRALQEFSKLPGKLRVVDGDVVVPAQIDAAMARHRIDRIIHGAAITAGAERDASDPQRIAAVNLGGTLNILAAARKHDVRRLVYIGTGSVYGGAGLLDGGLLDEEAHAPRPVSMYGITKYAAERSCLRLRELWNLDVVVGRLAMVYGCWEYETGLRDQMSLLLQALRIAARGGEAVLPSSGELRDWIYAVDVARALVMLLDAKALGHTVYNIGTGDSFTLSDWCEKLRAAFPGFRYRLTDHAAQWNVVPLAAAGRSPFAAERIRADLGFTPRFLLERAFDHYLAWWQAHPM